MNEIETTIIETITDVLAQDSEAPDKYGVQEQLAEAVQRGEPDALARLFDVDLSQIMALGDDYNDIPMLKRAGCSVAMANAVPEAKAAAKHVTDTNNNDGVAKAIQKFVFGIDDPIQNCH